MAPKSNPAATASQRAAVITRVFDAPRALVFQAWTDPRHVAQWWGPDGFTNPVCELDARPGGAIRIDMRGLDGTVYPMTGVYREVVEPERLVFACTALDGDGRPVLEVLNTVTFEEHGRKTKLTLRAQVVRTTGVGDTYAEGMEAGWTQSLERLGRHVAQDSGSTADREIVLTRVLDAPRELVWRALTDPAQVVRWWGPVGFTTTTHRIEVKPGGQWRFVMHGPDGRDYGNLITYLEVVAPERLTYKHGGDKDCEPVRHETTWELAREGAAGERTRLTLRMVFPSADARDFAVREYGALEGGKQTLGRLAEHLQQLGTAGAPATGSATEHPFIITRVLSAPLDVVYRMWTQREHLMRWFGPKGCTIPRCTLDLRIGGVFHYCMQMADGSVHWGRWVFREIVPPERLVFVVSFADEAGRPIRAPFDASWPLETHSTVTFAEHAGKGGGTVVTVQWSPIDATEVERQTFADGHASMQQGWSGTFDQLADYLKTR